MEVGQSTVREHPSGHKWWADRQQWFMVQARERLDLAVTEEAVSEVAETAELDRIADIGRELSYRFEPWAAVKALRRLADDEWV